jgi:hypothetical protein
MASARHQVLGRYRELLRLIERLPGDKRTAADAEARSLFRDRRTEQDPQRALDHQRELASKIAYLRMVTPKTAADTRTSSPGTTYVLRDGKLVEGSGEVRGGRWAACMHAPRRALLSSLHAALPRACMLTHLVHACMLRTQGGRRHDHHGRCGEAE